MAWLIGIGLLTVALWLGLRSFLARTAIVLSSVQTSGTPEGVEIIVSVARRDLLRGMSHGAAPQMSRAWLSDGTGHELPHLLSSLHLPAPDGLGGLQWGWRIAKTIEYPPKRVVFHATFVAPGAEPFEFEQDLRDGIDFNRPDDDHNK